MKKIMIILLIILGLPSFCKTINGEIKKETRKNSNQVYDLHTNTPIEGVVIKIPAKSYITKTDKNGSFKLQTQINSPTIMSLEKNGYKPYSLTLDSEFRNPLNIAIEKTTPQDIVVETDMVHIGDDSFSQKSANASEFSLHSSGAFYSKDFYIKNIKPQDNLFVVIGSVIGIDTIEARRMGQSGVLTAYASPPEVYFNGNAISSIKINGDNQKIQIPQGLIKSNGRNNITIKAGRNLYKTSNVDYDDIEFTNLLFEIK